MVNKKVCPPANKPKIDVIVGTQWGDEGKSKVASYLANGANLDIRSTGGNNAGHTVKVGEHKFALNLVPGGIVHGVESIIAPGVVVNPKVLLSNMDQLTNGGIVINPDILHVSKRCHIIMPYHQKMDAFLESLKAHAVGTTGTGNGPVNMDKANRTGIRMCDLLLPVAELEEKIHIAIGMWNILLKSSGKPEFQPYTNKQIEKMAKQYHKYGAILSEYICETKPIIDNALKSNGHIVIEGAQAARLDIDHGDYPMVTSSSPNASGTLSGAGIGPSNLYDINVIGIAKSHTSRVGEGPFSTEQNNEIGNYIREVAHEYGTTTGRPRRTGWTDLVLIKDCKYTLGLNSLALNHVDTIGVIGNYFGYIDVCTSYIYKGNQIDYVPTDIKPGDIVPIYKRFSGGWKITPDMRSYDQLPTRAKQFIEFVEEEIGTFIKYIGIGPDDADMIIRD